MRSLSWQPCAQLSQGLYFYGKAREQMLEDVLAKEHRGLAASGLAYPLLPRRRTAGREQVCWCFPTAWRLGEGSGSGCQGGETEAEVQSWKLSQQGGSRVPGPGEMLNQGLGPLTPSAGGAGLPASLPCVWRVRDPDILSLTHPGCW